MSEKNTSYQIIFENESILVLNKPTAIHSTAGKNTDLTITDFLKKDYPENFKINNEGGLLQRLDFETSGCQLVAKNSIAFNFFKDQIKKHQVVKEYLLLSNQKLAKPVWAKNYLFSRYRGSKKVSILEKGVARSLYAETLYSPEKAIINKNIFLIRATTSFGRRHQVRAQAGHLNIPLIGDTLYGSQVSFTDLQINNFPSFLLHGYRLCLPKNQFSKKIDFTAPLPAYLADFIKNH